jgi:cytoskeletal protein RodZ
MVGPCILLILVAKGNNNNSVLYLFMCYGKLQSQHKYNNSNKDVGTSYSQTDNPTSTVQQTTQLPHSNSPTDNSTPTVKQTTQLPQSNRQLNSYSPTDNPFPQSNRQLNSYSPTGQKYMPLRHVQRRT